MLVTYVSISDDIIYQKFIGMLIYTIAFFIVFGQIVMLLKTWYHNIFNYVDGPKSVLSPFLEF